MSSETVTDGVSVLHESGSKSSPRQSPPEGLSREELIEQLKRENQALRARLLGVNELARLLQEKTEACDNLRDRNKRQEIAIIRLENRCSNYDKKLRQAAAAGGAGAGAGPAAGGGASMRSGQSPFIPGPSRQILEGLMKENSELRKTVNNVTKKGQSGYLEAVVRMLIRSVSVSIWHCLEVFRNVFCETCLCCQQSYH